MRYYCKNCVTEFKFKDGTAWEDDNCPYCGNDDPDHELIPIPEHETPEQYEKRTGNKWPEQGAVWFRLDYGETLPDGGAWGVCRYITAVQMEREIVVCAQSPEMPPDDWRPE